MKEIRRVQTRPWVIMEVCGGQTHSIVKHGIDHLLPEGVELVHGPGCPVCVTSLELSDKAHGIARQSETILCSFGDMLRVPGSECDLFALKSRGADVRVVYSPLDCPEDRARTPRQEGRIFRSRVRDYGTRECDGSMACEATRDSLGSIEMWKQMMQAGEEFIAGSL